MRLVFVILKFGLLAAIYFFVLRVFYLILKDLRNCSGRIEAADSKGKKGFQAELVVTESSVGGLKPGDILKIGPEAAIGRGTSNDLKISDSFASHRHARINFENEKYYLEDLNSINGTYINGVRIGKKTTLEHGDIIKIAGVTFKFVRWEYEVE